MPDSASIREIVVELLLMETVRERLVKNLRGKGIPAEELPRQISSWGIK